MVWLVFPTDKMVAAQLFETDRLIEVKGTREIDYMGVKKLVLVLELVDEVKNRAEGCRTWVTADGLLAMVARMQEITESKKVRMVTLIKRDESTITVPAAMLSRSDQNFIQKNPISVPVVVAVPMGVQPTPTAVAAKKPKDASDGAARVIWFNETDQTTLRRAGDNRWEEVDNKSGEIKFELQETGRDEESIEWTCPKRKLEFRLLAQKLEQKQDGTWKPVADGRWLKSDTVK
jgi:hypothetical protein